MGPPCGDACARSGLANPSAQARFNPGRGRDRDDVGALGGMQRLSQIAGRQQVTVPVFAIEEQDVDVAGELAVLKAVIENVG